MIDLYTILGAIGAAILAVFAAFAKGAKSGAQKAELKQAKATEKAHERLNNAKTGSADDHLNIGSLHEFAQRHGKR